MSIITDMLPSSTFTLLKRVKQRFQSGNYNILTDFNDDEVEMSSPARHVHLSQESCLDHSIKQMPEIKNFMTRKMVDNMFLNKFVTVHKTVQASERSLWTLRGLFRYIEHTIDQFDCSKNVISVAPKVRSNISPPISSNVSPPLSNNRRNISPLSTLPPRRHAAHDCCEDSIASRRPSIRSNHTSYNDMTITTTSKLVDTKLSKYNTFGSSDRLNAMLRTTGSDCDSVECSVTSHGSKHIRSKSVNNHVHKHGKKIPKHRHKATTPCSATQSSQLKAIGRFSPDNDNLTAPLCTQRLVFRDLRSLDFQFNHLDHESVIVVRRHCLIFSFYPITAVIMADKVMLLTPHESTDLNIVSISHESSAFVGAFETYMKEWSIENERASPASRASNEDMLPFELCALEGLFTIIKSYEQQELTAITNSVSKTLKKYYQAGVTPPHKVEAQFRLLKSNLFSLKKRVVGYKGTLIGLMENDEQMALMNLTFLRKYPEQYRYPLSGTLLHLHEEVEELLAAYLLDFVNLEYSIIRLETKIRNSEEMYKLQLHTVENRALISHTALELLICCTTFGGYIAGAWGMNLDNDELYQEIAGGFKVVFFASLFNMVVIYYTVMWVFMHSRIFPVTIIQMEIIPLFASNVAVDEDMDEK